MASFLKLTTGDYLLLVDGVSRIILNISMAIKKRLLLIGVGR